MAWYGFDFRWALMPLRVLFLSGGSAAVRGVRGGMGHHRPQILQCGRTGTGGVDVGVGAGFSVEGRIKDQNTEKESKRKSKDT